MHLFETLRTHRAHDHALISPESFVRSPLPGWAKTQGIILIAPAMGARFTQYLAEMEPGGISGAAAAGVERVIYVLDGSLRVHRGDAEHTLESGGYVYVPADQSVSMRAKNACRLNVFEKQWIPPAEYPSTPAGASLTAAKESPGQPVIGREQDVDGQPFLGDPDARLQVLLPDTAEFDLAVNVFRFKPGAALPFVEMHVMEHGLLMLAGQGIYRLSDRWYPVRAG